MVFDAVSANPASDKRVIARYINARGGKTVHSEVNPVLYALETSGHLRRSRHALPLWSVSADDHEPAGRVVREQVQERQTSPPVTPARFRDAPPLRKWQKDALSAWERAQHRGVIQAVTGTGKTRVGIEAATAEIARGGKVLILVPTNVLLQQWYAELVDHFGAASVGRRGDSLRDSFQRCRVLIATMASACNDSRLAVKGLLVVDECHRAGAESWGDALYPSFTKRMGLTATFERGDDGDADLAKFFGGKPVFDITYRRAITEGVVSPFRLAFLGVDLGRSEMAAYREHEKICGAAFAKLKDAGIPTDPFGKFMKEVSRAANGHYGGRAQRAAWTYHKHFQGRRAILADTSAKLARLETLERAVASANGTLVFTQTKRAASQAAEMFRKRGLRTAAIWSGVRKDARERVIGDFRDGRTDLLAAPRILDEGINLPDADLGIVVSASNTKRQMIQRMGRVLRLKSDGRSARLAILYAAGTSEDPASGAHEAFIDIAADVAEETKTFSPKASAAQICTFLEAGRTAQPRGRIP